MQEEKRDDFFIKVLFFIGSRNMSNAWYLNIFRKGERKREGGREQKKAKFDRVDF